MTATERTAAPFVRLTILGAARNTDLVLPTDRSPAALLPDLLTLLGEPATVGRYDLVTPLGQALHPDVPLCDTALVDGDRLHVRAVQESPPAPVVADMVETTEATSVPGRWSATTRPWVGSLIGGAGLAGALWVATIAPGAPRAALLLGIAGAICIVASLVLALLHTRPPAVVLAALGIASAVAAVVTLGLPTPAAVYSYAGIVALSIAAVGWCSDQLRAAASAVVALAVLVGVAALTEAFDDRSVEIGAVTALLALVVLGAMPRMALLLSGVFALDTSVSDHGTTVPVRVASAVIGRAHWQLAGTVVVLAAAFGTAGFIVGNEGRFDPWPTAFAVLALVAFALRGRHFPLAVERWAVWSASVAALVGVAHAATVHDSDWGVPAALALLAVAVIALLAGNRPLPSHPAAQLRRIARRVETVTVLLTVPAFVGVFGVYSTLLHTFS